jgi:hypothetical protein
MNDASGCLRWAGHHYKLVGMLGPLKLLRYTDKFEDPNLPGEIQMTVKLKKVSVGTQVEIVQEGIPEALPVDGCYLGWQESLRNLAKLVEPEIPQ